MKEEINWVTREDTCALVIIKGKNLKGAIRNRKVLKKAQKRRPQYNPTSHTKLKKRVQKDKLLPSRLTHSSGVSEGEENHYY